MTVAPGPVTTRIVRPLFAVGATRRWATDGITANAVHPGSILETNLSRHMDQEEIGRLRAARDEETVTSPITAARIRFKTVEQGAATSVLVATSPQLDGIGGRYLEDCHEAAVLEPGAPDTSSSGVMSYAVDPHAGQRLWDVSLEMLGLD